jgi:poly-gamma-glutamate biosynthesis protein PgsC/CapC
MEPLVLSIGVGLVIGLVFVSLFGLSTGGMIVPGYLALQLGNPLAVSATILAALLIYFLVNIFSRYMIIYGRRRIALTILLAFIIGVVLNDTFDYMALDSILNQAIHIIGYIIPGLIALSMDRQGVLETIGSLLIASVLVRLVLIIFIGDVIIQI